MKIRKIYQHEAGQAVAEFGLALLILLPLIFWMLRLGTLFNLKHKAIESARLAVWERAHGADEQAITELITRNIKSGALFTNPSNLEVGLSLTQKPSQHEIKSMADLPRGLGLGADNYYVSEVTVQGDLLLGVKFSANGKYAMLADPWNLTDRDRNRRIDDDDLKDAVKGIFLWFPGIGPATSGAIGTFLDTFEGFQEEIRSFPLVGTILRAAGVDLDIDPRGHPRLDAVPKPSQD